MFLLLYPMYVKYARENKSCTDTILDDQYRYSLELRTLRNLPKYNTFLYFKCSSIPAPKPSPRFYNPRCLFQNSRSSTRKSISTPDTILLMGMISTYLSKI